MEELKDNVKTHIMQSKIIKSVFEQNYYEFEESMKRLSLVYKSVITTRKPWELMKALIKVQIEEFQSKMDFNKTILEALEEICDSLMRLYDEIEITEKTSMKNYNDRLEAIEQEINELVEKNIHHFISWSSNNYVRLLNTEINNIYTEILEKIPKKLEIHFLKGIDEILNKNNIICSNGGKENVVQTQTEVKKILKDSFVFDKTSSPPSPCNIKEKSLPMIPNKIKIPLEIKKLFSVDQADSPLSKKASSNLPKKETSFIRNKEPSILPEKDKVISESQTILSSTDSNASTDRENIKTTSIQSFSEYEHLKNMNKVVNLGTNQQQHPQSLDYPSKPMDNSRMQIEPEKRSKDKKSKDTKRAKSFFNSKEKISTSMPSNFLPSTEEVDHLFNVTQLEKKKTIRSKKEKNTQSFRSSSNKEEIKEKKGFRGNFESNRTGQNSSRVSSTHLFSSIQTGVHQAAELQDYVNLQQSYSGSQTFNDRNFSIPNLSTKEITTSTNFEKVKSSFKPTVVEENNDYEVIGVDSSPSFHQPSTAKAPVTPQSKLYRVDFSFMADGNNTLSISKGQVVSVDDGDIDDNGWCLCVLQGENNDSGYVPYNYLSLL